MSTDILQPTTASKQRLCRGNSMGNTSGGESRDPLISPSNSENEGWKEQFLWCGGFQKKHKLDLYQDWGTLDSQDPLQPASSSSFIPISIFKVALSVYFICLWAWKLNVAMFTLFEVDLKRLQLLYTPKTNSPPLKIDGRETFSFPFVSKQPIFRGDPLVFKEAKWYLQPECFSYSNCRYTPEN